MNLNQTVDRRTTARFSGIWSLLRHEFLYVAWALMEVALITPVILSFAPWTRFWPPLQVATWLVLLMLLPFNLSRLMSILRLPVDRQQIVMVGALLTTLLLAFRLLLFDVATVFDLGWLGEFFRAAGQANNPLWIKTLLVLLTVAFAWWRGISLIGRRVDIDDVGLRFRLGALISAPVVAGLAASRLLWPVTPLILLFFFASLVAIVLTRVEQLELDRTGGSFPLGPRWIGTVLAAATAVVFAAGALTALVTGESIVRLIGSLTPLWLAISFLSTAILATVSLLLTPVLVILSWLFGLLASVFGQSFQNTLDNLDLTLRGALLTSPFEQSEELGGSLSPVPRQLLGVLSILLVVLLVSLALNRVLRMMRQPSQVESEHLSPLDSLGNLEPPALGRKIADRFGLLRRWRTAASIRRVYREMSRTAANAGFPRANEETPNEYLTTLAEAWPDNDADTQLITQAYNRVRYGEIPETKEELDEILAAWNRLSKSRISEIRPAESKVELKKKR